MYNIRLDDGTIEYEGSWVSTDDLSRMIQEKIEAGEMKIAKVAKALEELNNALENAVTIETKIVITKDEYNQLKSLGGEDDRECVRMAISAFIAEADSKTTGQVSARKAEEKKKAIVKCTKCKTPIEITTDERPVEIKCPKCGATGRLKA